MRVFVDYQYENFADVDIFIAKAEELEQAVNVAAEILNIDNAELTIALLTNEEIQDLNFRYRDKNYPTNVLSFPFEAELDFDLEKKLLGDILIAPLVLNKEASEQNKTDIEHWIHIAIHGFLHLLGYDHIEDNDALVMEDLERKILAKLGYKDPYLIN